MTKPKLTEMYPRLEVTVNTVSKEAQIAGEYSVKTGEKRANGQDITRPAGFSLVFKPQGHTTGLALCKIYLKERGFNTTSKTVKFGGIGGNIMSLVYEMIENAKN